MSIVLTKGSNEQQANEIVYAACACIASENKALKCLCDQKILLLFLWISKLHKLTLRVRSIDRIPE